MKKQFFLFLIILFTGFSLLFASCGTSNSSRDTGADDDTNSDSDSDTDSDTDTDTDSDTDSDVTPIQSSDIVFTPSSSTFEGSIEVQIAGKTSGMGDIHYTVDGSAPTESSPVFDASISVSETTEIHAATFENGEIVAQGTAVYIPRQGDIDVDLPIVVIDNFGAGEPDREYVDAVFMIFDTHEGTASLSADADVASKAGFHLRGQSSASFDKRPYRLELRDSSGDDLDWPILGMPAESDWILRGPFVDKALIRDAFHYTLGKEVGLEAPRFRFCELYKNVDGDAIDEGDYEGVYMLIESIKNTKNRQDLKQLRAEDVDSSVLSGGYIFKFEWNAAEEPLLPCPQENSPYCWQYNDGSGGGNFGMPASMSGLEIVDPFDINSQQADWLAEYLFKFSEALHTSTLNDAANGYGQYIDVTSFADQIILNEIGREADAYIRSAYFYKDRNDVLFAGPLWDYNLSLGTGFDMGQENLATSGWMYEVNDTRQDPSNDWFITMVQDPEFAQLLSNRWKELRQGVFSDSELNALIDELASPLKNGANRNFERWPNLGSATIGFFESPVSDTWEEQIEAMRDWLMERTIWLDSQWN